ncbi:MAG: hypothetical protein ACREDL_05665 [Bradyrhizobium sp.]
MPKATPLILALSGTLALAASPVRAQTTNRALLLTFCDAANIKGATCSHARAYPDGAGRACDVKLTGDRYEGRFIAGRRLLVAAYQSGCEAHVNDDGGAVVFEQVGGAYALRNFTPGVQAGDCVTLNRDDRQDWLVCLTGHMGQGVLESGVARMAFTVDYDGRISIAPDFLLTGEDSSSAFGANVVTCKTPWKYFDVSHLRPGPRANTVSVDASYADAGTIRTACGKGFPKPKETYGDLAPGDAYVPDGFEKNGTFVIDLLTRKVTPLK